MHVQCTAYFYLWSLQFYRNLASTYEDNERFCTVLLTSQVVMVQSLQPTGREFESACNPGFYLYSIHFMFIY